jgi:hypothetical protein
MISSRGFIEAFGLIDAGADQVFVPVLVAEALGITLHVNQAEPAIGAGGHELKTWAGEIEIEIMDDHDHRQRWTVPVGFMETEDDFAPALLGHAGFLEYFTATFDGAQQTVELVPNNRFPRQ